VLIEILWNTEHLIGGVVMVKKAVKPNKDKAKNATKKLQEIIEWELRHKLDKMLDEEPLYKVIKWARQNGLSASNNALSDYKKLRKEGMLAEVVKAKKDEPAFKKGEVAVRPDNQIEFFHDHHYDLAKETIGREMNLLNGVIQAARNRLTDPNMLKFVDTNDLLKAALTATKVKAQIMGPEAYQYEVHFQELQKKMEAVLGVINECVDEETRVRIYQRLRDLEARDLVNS
jgi:hypothetical protein